MSFRIAVAGKGGTGKTTLVGLIIRALIERDRGAVMAVDADPNSSLGMLLGMEPDTCLADIREDGNEKARTSTTAESKHAALEYALQAAVCEGQGVDMVTMGRPEGPGCYCYVNNLLRGFLEDLAVSYPWVVVDNEAGMEHLSRRTTNNVDLLLIVYELTALGIKTARRLDDLSRQLPVEIKRRVFVANRVPAEGPNPKLAEMAGNENVTADVNIPSDEVFYGHSATGESVFDMPEDCPALITVRDALDRWGVGVKDPSVQEVQQ